MVTFKIGETIVTYDDFSKHHKRLPLCIGRTELDGSYTNYINEAQLQKDVDANPDAIVTKISNVYKDRKIQDVTDHFIWLQNADYQERTISNYSIGAINTSQETFIRLAFQFEDALAYLDYSYKSSGSYASSFYDMAMNDRLESILEDIVDTNQPIETCGIRSEDKDIYTIIVVENDGGPIIDIEVSLYELQQAFVGIEVYDFKQTIHEEAVT